MHRHTDAPARTRIALAAALAGGLFLTACGGGGSSDEQQQPLTQSEATAYAADGVQSSNGSASSADAIFDTTQTVASASVTAAAAASDRMHALGATGIVDVQVPCDTSGTATVTISGSTVESQLNGHLDAGEHYNVSFAQCSGPLGVATLNGSVELDVTNVSTTASGTTTAANLAVNKLTLAYADGSVVLDGAASLSRVATATTTTSTFSASSISLASTYKSRSANFTISDAEITRVVTAAGSTLTGHHTLSGTANGRDFSIAVSTTGGVTYDAFGNPVAGQWTTKRGNATIVSVLANGIVILTDDEGSNGTIDATWTITLAQLLAASN
jgi:hypothetical protein